MRKFLLLVFGFLISACTQEQPVTTVYVPINEHPIMETSTAQPVLNAQKQEIIKAQTAEKTTPVLGPKKTYMAELAKELHDTVDTTGIVVKQQDAQVLVVFPNEVLFGTNQTAFEEQIEPILAGIARSLKTYDRVKIQICGYTDNEGTVADNKAYSLRQANELSNFLRLNGVDINRITVDGLGPYNPIVNNDTALNRRRNDLDQYAITQII